MRFHIALNMAGAVSAGAYTAGVLDFLVEALDAWYAEKAKQREQFGDDTRLWTIPAHYVGLDVMSGASAGGMCSAIGSVALREQFEHVHAPVTGPGVAVNRLYQSWVETIDIVPLLGSADLPGGKGPVHSILDSTPIAQIAQTALKPDPSKALDREWVAEKLGVILTLTNLRGVPYSVDEANAGSFEERMTNHADRIQFCVADKGVEDTDCVYGLNYSDAGNSNWKLLETAAMATGAFPVMLATRVLERKRADYEKRLWNIAGQEPAAIPPAWDDSVVPATFDNAHVDGGVTNNDPFELARQYVAAAAGNDGQNPRSAELANAAVISVAPFPGDDNFQAGYDAAAQTELGNVVSALIGVLVNQSRFQGENLLLTKDPDVYSRFEISPSDDSAGNKPALLCGALGAFGGFVERKFRDHDYQLGRRNCQKFLMDVFVLPEDNATVQPDAAKTPEALAAVRKFGFQEGGRYWYPIIPLMPGVATEIPAPNRSDFFTTEARLVEVAQAAEARLKAVLEGFASSSKDSWLWKGLIAVLFDLGGGGRIKALVLEKLKEGLAGQTAA
jgi:hypothetical protein